MATTSATKLPQPDFAVSLDEFADMVVNIFIPGDVPAMIWSPPGWGKSAKIAQVVRDELKMGFMPVYGSSMQECDANGLPNFKVLEDGRRITEYTVPELIIQCEKRPTVVFFDELPRCSLQVLCSLLPAVSPERQLGVHKFPEHTRFLAAGNNCGSGNTTLPEAMEDRWNNQFLRLKWEEFVTWGALNGLNPCVISHIQHNPDSLFEAERIKSEKGHASPRQWESVSKLTNKVLDAIDPASGKSRYSKDQVRSLVAGSVGQGNARQYVAWMDLLPDLEPISYVISNPDKAKVPTEKSHLYVIVSALSRHASLANWKAINVYLDRLPDEFKLMAVTSAVRREPRLLATPEYIKHSVLSKELVS